MLQKPLTKKQKKEVSRKRLGIILIFLGLLVIASVLFFMAFLEKDPPIVNPLSKDQTSNGKLIINSLGEKKITYKDLETTKDLKYKIIFEDNAEAIIDPKKDLEEQITSLQLILSQLKIEGKAFKRLDFSYQKPIIAF